MPAMVNESLDQTRMQWAEAALELAATTAQAASSDNLVPADLQRPDGWRWRVLGDLTDLSAAVTRDLQQAQARQRRQAWESRFGGPLATGGGAAVGSIVAAVGAGLVKTNAVGGWVVVVLGVVLAIGTSVITANNYVQNRNKRLRFSRLVHDIWDFAYLVLPTASPVDTFTHLDNLRILWETAGS